MSYKANNDQVYIPTYIPIVPGTQISNNKKFKKIKLDFDSPAVIIIKIAILYDRLAAL